MSGIYTLANLYADVTGDSAGAGVENIMRIMNRAVREVVDEIDLRSMKRMSYLAPLINENQFDYTAPSDLKGTALVDLRRLDNRVDSDKFRLVTTEFFDRRKDWHKNLICIEDQNFLKKLRVSADLNSDGDQATLHDMGSLTANGTWAASGSASNLAVDSVIFVEGLAALKFDVGASYTSALLTNSTFATVDLTDYVVEGAVFLFVDIPSTTGLTSFKLRVGTDASNYYEMTATTTNEGLAFQNRWNLLRFSFSGATETGSVTDTTINYARLEIVGAGSASATTNWRVDYLVAMVGIEHQVWYYTKYGWQTSAGAYIENATTTTDLINCDTEEYDLFVRRGKQLVAEQLKFWDEADKYEKRFLAAKNNYQMSYASERLLMIQNYRDFTTDFNSNSLL